MEKKTLFNNNISSYIENRSTYFDGVNQGGQEHVLKRVMMSIPINIKNV